jgi:hypothetical protein
MAASTSAEIQVEGDASAGSMELQNVAYSRINSASAESQDDLKEVAGLIIELEHLVEMSEPPFNPLHGFGIYRVPRDIREVNEKAYTPKYISIGPLHFGANETLRAMQKLKVKYFKMFVQKAQVSVEKLVRTVSGRAVDIRGCYAGTSELDSYNYQKMILLDASFIIVFFLISFMPAWEYRSEVIILKSQLRDDLLLLENQLPFSIIRTLYDLAFPPSSSPSSSSSKYPSFMKLTFEIFDDYNSQNIPLDPNLKIMHFVDLIRTFFLPLRPLEKCDERITHLYTASQLHMVGVKFNVSSSKCLFDLKFTNGVLEIPHLQVDHSTERFFRNIIALEQSYYRWESYVSDYIRILDFLIDTAEDVDLLEKNGILVNNLGDSNAVATMINNLNKGTSLSNMNTDYYRLCENLNTFYKDPRHSWEVALRREHFSNPWRIMATVGAIILLLLTLGQTICSIIQVVQKK